MRVAIVTSELTDLGGGVKTVVEAFSRSLADQGVEVKVFGTGTKTQNLDVGDNWNGAPAEVFAALGPSKLGFSPALITALFKWKPDVVHTHGLWQGHGAAVRIWKQKTGRPVVVSPHGMLDAEAMLRSSAKKRIARFFYDDFNIRHAEVLHVLSEREAQRVRPFVGQKKRVVIIPNGIFLRDVNEQEIRNRYLDRSKNTSRTLLYLGRIHDQKGLMRFLKALNILSTGSYLDRWKIIIAGWSQANHETELKSFCAENGLNKVVSFAGPKFGPGKDALLRETADAFILPSETEALPMTVLEAWSYGLPVLMTDECNLTEAFALGAAHRISLNPESMAADIAEFLSMKDAQIANLGINGLRLAQADYTWESVAKRFVSEYEAVLSNGSGDDNE